MDMSLLSNEAVLGYMVGGIYYDAVKTRTVSSFIAIKEKIKPLKTLLVSAQKSYRIKYIFSKTNIKRITISIQ